MKRLTIVTILIALGIVFARVSSFSSQAANRKSLDNDKDRKALNNLKNELIKAASHNNLKSLDQIVDNLSLIHI